MRTKPLLPPSLSIPCSKAESITVDIDFTLRAVEGWLELGCPQAALEELGDRRDSDEPKVLWYRVQIARDLGQGIEAVRLGTRLTARVPNSAAAWLLLVAVCIFPAFRADWAIRAIKTGLVHLPGNPALTGTLLALMDDLPSKPANEVPAAPST